MCPTSPGTELSDLGESAVMGVPLTYLLAGFVIFIVWWCFIRDVRPDKSIPLLFWDLPIIRMTIPIYRTRDNMIEESLKNSLKPENRRGVYTALPGLGLQLTVIDPKSIEMIYNDPDTFALPKLRKNLFGELFGDGIFMVNGESWKLQRKLAHNIFTNKSRAEMFPVYEKCTQNLFKVLDTACELKTPVDIQTIFKQFTLDTFGEIGFGYSINSLISPIPFSSSMDWLLLETDERFFDPTRKYWNKKVWDEHLQNCISFVDGVITERRRTGFEGRSDYLSHLLRMEAEGECEPLSNQFLRDQLTNFFIAGRDTTAVLLMWSSYFLSQNPEVEKELRAEVDEVLAGKKNEFSNSREFKFMQKVMDESLRLYPPAVPFNTKVVCKDCELPNGVRVKKGQHIGVNVCVVHRLPEYWGEDALEFKPHRWDSPLKHPYQFIPFQRGSRSCLGMNMAYEEAKYVMSSLLQRYSWSLVEGQTVAYKVTAILTARNGIQMNFSRK